MSLLHLCISWKTFKKHGERSKQNQLFQGHFCNRDRAWKLFALRESRRGTWRQALRGLEAQKLSGYAIRLWKVFGASWRPFDRFLDLHCRCKQNSHGMQLQNQRNPFGEQFHETILGHSRSHLEESRAVLGPFWSLLGASWEGLGSLLGGSWGLLRGLGASWGTLEASWGGLLGVCCRRYFFYNFLLDFGSILGSKRLPKSTPNRSQNGPKSKAKINMKNDRFWNPLGSVLGPSWGILGSILGSKIIKFHWFLKGFVNIHIFDPDKVWDDILMEFWRFLMPKRVQNGSQMGPKFDPKWYQKTIKK